MAADNIANFDPEDIHVVRGDTAGYAVRTCLGIQPDQILTETADLSFGPLPDGLAMDGAKFDSGGAIYLWLGALLSERLLAARFFAALKSLNIDHGRVWLVDLSRISQGTGHASSIATLDCDRLDLIGPWQTLDAGMVAVHEAAWEALSDPSPKALINYCTRDAERADDPVHALRAFLTRYPAVDGGLPFWDRLLLENCRTHGPDAARVVGHTMAHDTPYPDWPGDDTLYQRLKRMAYADLPHPLVKLSGDPGSMRTAEAALTNAGERVLDGTDNAIALNGIDDWTGGVHQDPKSETLWLHNGETLIPADPDGTPRKGRKGDRRR
jgi:hypothetical protein